MSMVETNENPHKPFFVNQFVNTVYGIIIGFGFANSLERIESTIESPDVMDTSNSVPFSIVAVLFVIITICVYWWDWVDNVGYRVQNNSREFTVDIAILFALNFLFFSYDHIIAFSIAFVVLSVLNLLWVYNFRFGEYEALSKAKQSPGKYRSWLGYLKENEQARNHIRRRWYGVALYCGCSFLISLPILLNSGQSIDNYFAQSFLGITAIPNEWSGNWAALMFIAGAGLVNRIWFYQDRFEKD